MRNTLQEQYNLLKEGKMNKQHFFKSARHLFPDLITPTNSFTDAVTILKNRGVISEGIGGLVTTGKKQDWMSIFNENITTLKEEKEAKAEEKETTKEVTDMATRGYDYKDEKNYDNVFGQEFLQGFYTEMGDPKNEDKSVEELRAIVAKNLAKDCNYYVKDGQFGVKGLGYTTEAPGLGEPKEAKGKYKSSGYGDLKESKHSDEADLKIYKSELNLLNKVKPTGEKHLKRKEYLEKEIEKLEKKLDSINEDFRYGDLKESVLRLAIQDIIKEVIDESKQVNEALNMEAIKAEGEDAKKKVMERRITNEIVKRKKQIKALETLTELEGNEDNTKKVKELQSEIKKLEGAKGKLHKVKEAGTYAGKKAKDDMKKDPDYNTLNPQAKADAEKKLDTGGSVTVGENKKK